MKSALEVSCTLNNTLINNVIIFYTLTFINHLLVSDNKIGLRKYNIVKFLTNELPKKASL